MAEDLEALEQKLETYLAQRSQLDLALVQDPSNEELLQLKGDLTEVIEMTEGIIDGAKGSSSQRIADEDEDAELERHLRAGGRGGGIHIVTEEEEDLDPALQMRFEKGMGCKAMWSSDGQWYSAVVTAVHPESGTYTVQFTGYGNVEQVTPSCIVAANEAPPGPSGAPAPAGVHGGAHGAAVVATGSQRGVAAAGGGGGKAKKAAGGINPTAPIEIPPGLVIQETDTEDVKARKKKKLHIYKATIRKQQLEALTQKKQSNWKNFLNGTKRKTGTFTNAKKKSMFATPDSLNGRVGVMNSGQGMTSFTERKVVEGHNKAKSSLPQP